MDGKWILPKDNHPSSLIKVLVTIQDEPQIMPPYTTLGAYDSDRDVWYDEDGNDIDYGEVTAWAFIPDAYGLHKFMQKYGTYKRKVK